jgi:hypothetical protein
MTGTRRPPRALLALLALLGLLGKLGCKTEVVPPTQMIVTINSDLRVGEQLSRIDVHVYDVDRKQLADERQFELSEGAPREGQVRLPFSFGIGKKHADRLLLEVLGYGPLGPGGNRIQVIERKLIVAFGERQTVLVKVFLGKACFQPDDDACADASLTCYLEAAGGVAIGHCGAVRESERVVIEPGEERDAWTGVSTTRDAGEDASGPAAPSDAGGGSGGSGGSGGAGGMDAGGDMPDATAPTDGGSGNGGGGGGGGGNGGSGGSGSSQDCNAKTTEHASNLEAPMHVDASVDVAYDSEPPSSGSHCDEYSAWNVEYDSDEPLPACYFVHNLEHHGLVLFYNCPDGCPTTLDDLRLVMANAPDDPYDCHPRRVILTPYEDMEATVAASVWGWTWTADCFDDDAKASLAEFIDDHWLDPTLGPEDSVCGGGSILPGNLP